MRISQPGPGGQANTAPWRRWLLPVVVAALLAVPRGARRMPLAYSRFVPMSAPGRSAR